MPDRKFVVGTRLAVAHCGFFIAGGAFVSPNADVTESREGCIIKGRGTPEVSHRKGEMMQHGHTVEIVCLQRKKE